MVLALPPRGANSLARSPISAAPRHRGALHRHITKTSRRLQFVLYGYSQRNYDQTPQPWRAAIVNCHRTEVSTSEQPHRVRGQLFLLPLAFLRLSLLRFFNSIPLSLYICFWLQIHDYRISNLHESTAAGPIGRECVEYSPT